MHLKPARRMSYAKQLSDEDLRKIGTTRSVVEKWLGPQGDEKSKLTDPQKATLGYLLDLDSEHVGLGEDDYIETAAIGHDVVNCHWGHAGLRDHDGKIHWYPISTVVFGALQHRIKHGFRRPLFYFATQNNKIVVANYAWLTEIVLLEESEDWGEEGEWDPVADYVCPGGVDFYRAITAIDLEEEYLLPEFQNELAETCSRAIEDISTRSRIITTTFDREFHLDYDRLDQNVTEMCEAENVPICLNSLDSWSRAIPQHSLVILEMPRATYMRSDSQFFIE